MAEDSEPLLGRASSEQQRAQAHDDDEDENTYKQAPSLARFLGALSQGKLPDNGQLFTLFHKSAAFLDGMSSSVSNSLDEGTSNGHGYDAAELDPDDPVFSDDTAMVLATLLKESGALCRLLARWIYGEEAKEEQKPDTMKGARGNEREQWQRLLWHLSQAFSLDTALPVGLDADVPFDVQRAKDNIKEGARQVKEDTKKSGRSILQLISLVVGSDEFRRIPSDLVHFLRSSLADQVSEVGTRVDNVDDALRGPDGGGGGEVAPVSEKEKDFVEPDEALRETGKAIEAVVDGVKMGKGKERQSDGGKSVDDAVRDQAVNRIARLLDTLQSNEKYHHAVQTLVAVSEKYLELLERAKQDVSASLNSAEGKDGVEKMQSLAADGAEKVEEEVKATIASTQLKSKVSARVSHHFVEALKAGREVLEGIAGGRSLETISQKVEGIKEKVERDNALQQWLKDVNDFLTRSIGDGEGGSVLDFKTDEAKQELHTLYSRLQELLRSRPDVLNALDDLKASCRAFYEDAIGDVALHRIRARIARITHLATLTLWEGAQDIKTKGSQIVSMLINAVVPSIGDILGSVPIPRVEFTSDHIDAAVEDVVIPVVSLIPDAVQVTTMNDWEWKRNPRRKTTQSNLDTNLKIGIRGIQLAITDISFYVQERFTAPSPASCLGCCSFGRSQSQWCLLRGPSSWLAYTESALLDVGFWKRGLGVTLDLSDAGQEEQKAGKNAKKSRDQMWDDDTTMEGKRTHFFNVNKVDVQVSDSFDFHLRESRHWLINALLRAASKPLLKVVMRRIISAQIQHGYELVDAKLWDYHYRAKRLSMLRAERLLKWEKHDLPQVAGLQRQDVHPGLWDYVSVLTDADAGKSKARIRLEQLRAEELQAEAAAKEREQEEQKAKKTTTTTTTTTTQQPKPAKKMEVKSTSIIRHDEDGQYSLSIGLAPRLLDASQSGPKTRHIKLRDDLVQRNYKNLANRPKEKLIDVYDQADVQGTVQSAAEEVRKGVDFVTDVVEGTQATSRVVGSDDGGRSGAHNDQGWRSDAFNL